LPRAGCELRLGVAVPRHPRADGLEARLSTDLTARKLRRRPSQPIQSDDGLVHLGRRVGQPAPFAIVASYFASAAVCWLAASAALVRAAPDLARGAYDNRHVLLAVHLVGLGFLPFAVAGGALHVLPVL